MRQYGKYAKPYLSAFIIGPIMMIVEVIGEVLMPWLLSVIINNGVEAEKGVTFIIAIGVLMIVTALCMMAGGVGGAYFATKASTSFANDLRKDVFRKVQQFSFADIDKFSTGSLVTRLTNDITQIQNLINMGLRMLLRAPGMLIGATIMAFAMNAKLALIIVIIMPILGTAIFAIVRVAFPRFQTMQKQLDSVNSDIQENLTNVRVVKSFVRTDYEEQKFGKANEELKRKSLHAMKVMILNFPVMNLCMNAATLAIVWFGGNQVIAGDMAVGDLTAFTNYVVQILSSLMMLSMIILNSSRALASSDRIKAVLNEEIDLTDLNAKEPEKEVTEGKISFRNVYFRYYKNNDEWVLENINLEIEPGETVGIIGSTGCGKTSLVSLIPRLYDVEDAAPGLPEEEQASVLVDDVDVRDYSLHKLRTGIGMVLQKNVLFSGTIMENLQWGNENADEAEVYKAAESAKAHDFISSFTDGYETELGQGGVNVSGGQKQRLCIARALLKKPKIIILDDSTSAVDTATEARIRENFATELKDTTKLIIAQRISSVIDADKIVVIDDGKIVGVGKHEELIANCHEYQEIYESQNGKEMTRKQPQTVTIGKEATV